MGVVSVMFKVWDPRVIPHPGMREQQCNTWKRWEMLENS